jgi:hypothetical protein
MIAVDHVIVIVADLDRAADRYLDELGLASVAGGRHQGHGTGNRIVPLGESYIELMAVVDRDEAASSPLGSWVTRRLLEGGEAPAALCLRTDDIAAAARRTGRAPLPMSRVRPDGVELAWHLVALDATLTEGLPFFIQWHVDEADHPGRTPIAHPSGAIGIDWVEIGGDGNRLASWLGDHDLPLRQVGGPPGLRRVAVAVEPGESIVIGPYETGSGSG